MATIPEIGPVLAAVVHIAAARGSRLTKLRLVKFLYLLDLYWAQANQVTFTNWPWAFVHYGPYCRESTDAIDAAAATAFITASSFESHYRDEDYRLYEPGSRLTDVDAEHVIESFPLHVSASLRNAIHRWHDDTYGLLNHVYFKTEPMQRAHPKDVLSFAQVSIPNYEQFRPIKMLPISSGKKKAVREAIGRLSMPTPPQLDAKLLDQEYLDFLSALEREETPTDFTGTADMEFEDRDDD